VSFKQPALAHRQATTLLNTNFNVNVDCMTHYSLFLFQDGVIDNVAATNRWACDENWGCAPVPQRRRAIEALEARAPRQCGDSG